MNSTDFFDVNGIKCVNIKCDSEISVFGIAIWNGSNFETPDIAGISHFAEHMFFKGTRTKNWKEINSSFAKLAVNNNAYTSNDEVFYHTTCPKENVQSVINIMMDMFFNSTIPEEELEKERSVIKEEKQYALDDPNYAFNSQIGNKFFVWEKGHDIIGTFETINSISRDDVVTYLEKHTHNGNVLFVSCGSIPTEFIKQYINKNMPSSHSFLKEGIMNTTSNDLWSDIINKDDKIKYIYKRDNIKQSNVQMITNGIDVTDSMYYASIIALNAIGGGMHSRLFERIREELGLCYAVGFHSYSMSFPSHNINVLYGYTSPNNVESFITESENVIENIKKNGLDQDIFQSAKADVLGKLLRTTETSFGKTKKLLRRYMIGDNRNLEELIYMVRNVKIEDCNNVLDRTLNQQFNWAIMMPND